MKFAPGRRRSIRYSIFIGVLAGSVFSGPVTYAADWELLSRAIMTGDPVILEKNGVYTAGAPGEGTYFGDYVGTLDGNGATITGLTVPLFNTISGEVKDLNLATAPLVDGVGGVVGNGALANTLGNTGTINNVTVTGDVTGYIAVGGLVGSSNGSINNSSVNGNVIGDIAVGGLVGEFVGEFGGSITNSNATGSVSGTANVGGLVGHSVGDITDSHATGSVSGTTNVGGLVGHSVGDITDSHATGSVSGTTNVGGLVGLSVGDITDSHATGDVSGVDNIGGLVGLLDDFHEITNSYATGDVTGSGEYIGGLVGDAYGTIEDSFATGNVTGTGEDEDYHGTGGLVGYLGGPLIDSSATGTVTGFNEVGGLVGSTGVAAGITNSHATGNVSGRDKVGGLVGNLDPYHLIIDSYATGNVIGQDYVGGLVGKSEGLIEGSTAPNEGSSVSGHVYVGGLVGYSSGLINDSHAQSNVDGAESVGGLVGFSSGNITDSTAEGNVGGEDYLGGLVGESSGDITNSWARGDVDGGDLGYDVGGLVGNFYEQRSISGAFPNLESLNNSVPDPFLGDIYLVASDMYIYLNDDLFVPGWINLGNVATISYSFAEGNVIGGSYLGGLVGETGGYASISYSYARGDVDGGESGYYLGGLVGRANGDITNSYATGEITGYNYLGGLVGRVNGDITNSYATGDITGVNSIGGLVGRVNGDITNSYATGDVDGGELGRNLGGLAWRVSGSITNSYATGNINGYESLGGLAYLVRDSITNSYATGGVIGVGDFDAFVVGGGFSKDDKSQAFSKSSPDAPSLLSVVNTEGTAGAPAFEIAACRNNGLPLLSELIASYENNCPTPAGPNRERRIREFIQTTSMTEIAKTLGFVISPKFPNDAPISFIKSEKEIAISKILGVQKAADRVARTFAKTGEALQISYEYESKDPIELWVKLSDGKWLLAGVAIFDKGGKVVVLPMQFKIAGEYLLVLNKPSAESVKANTPLNQIGSLTVMVS